MDLKALLSSPRLQFDLVSDYGIPVAVAIGISLLFSFLHRYLARRSAPSAINPFLGFPIFTLVMTTIFALLQFSVALSLGLLGSLSLVRFRVAIKNFVDISFVLASISVSLICALRLYDVLFVFCALFALVLLTIVYLTRGKPDATHSSLLALRHAGSATEQSRLMSVLRSSFPGAQLLNYRANAESVDVTLGLAAFEQERIDRLRDQFPPLQVSVSVKPSDLAD